MDSTGLPGASPVVFICNPTVVEAPAASDCPQSEPVHVVVPPVTAQCMPQLLATPSTPGSGQEIVHPLTAPPVAVTEICAT